MKKKRIVVIKDPRLQKIRNNVRMLIIKAVRDDTHNIEDEIKELELDKGGKSKLMDQITEEENNNLKLLYQKKAENRRSIEASICMCRTCSSTNNDMFFNPFTEEWFCIECVVNYSEAYLKYQRDPSKKPWDVDEVEIKFLKSFTASGLSTKVEK